MKVRNGKISILSLIIVTIITILLMTWELNSKTRVEAKYYNEKISAAQTTQQAFDVIKRAAYDIGLPIDRINDPNETGLIGLQYSPITTERGNLDAKLTSTNPNIAALIVELLKKAGTKKGDAIAVSLTGSYPALNIAILSAVATLELEPILITSVGSSMWGANYPEFTYLDMETALAESGNLEFKTTVASMGGEDDIGRGLSPAGREVIEQAALRNNVELLDAANLDDVIQQKMDRFTGSRAVRAYINAGESTTALAGTDVGSGLIGPRTIRSGQGLVAQFSKMGVPVINLVDLNQLAQEYHLPLAPIPLPDAGEGRLYYEYRYSVTIAIIALVILIVILFVVLRYDIDHYLKRRKND
jgi:poly-gamma-glutamate system protein